MRFFQTNNLAVLLGVSFALLIGMMSSVMFEHYTHMNRMQAVMSASEQVVLKQRYLSELMEFARTRTRMTNQIIDTEDVFDKDDLNQELEIFASRFARTYQALQQLPLDDHERAEFKRQNEIVAVILPAQRRVVDLSMHGEDEDAREEAKALFYGTVMPGQNNLIDLLQGLIVYHQKNAGRLIAATEQSLRDRLRDQNLIALGIFLVTALIAVFVVYRTHKTQRFLERERRALENLVEERTAELVHARDEAERANRAKSEFLSSMSHELRTPLNAILGFGQMLESDPDEPLSENQDECVRQILKGGEHLLELINEVLDLAKIESGKVELSIEAVSLATILDDALPLVETLAVKRDISVVFPARTQQQASVLADYTRLKQVLLNLMSNAVKYNREHGELRVTIARVEGGRLRIAVSDTGPGIAQDSQEELFLPFNRLGAEASEIEGTGIGLVITKKLIEMMDGEIGFESVVGQGSTFWVELPVAQEAAPEAEMNVAIANAEDASHAVKGTMLYVEDNPDNLRLMEMVIKRIDGLEMVSAHTGELGMEMALSAPPDLIVLDINLPGMDGLEVVAELRHDPRTRDIPIFALSAAATERDIARGMEAGFDRYLTKPMVISDILSAIEEALSKS